MVVNSVGPLEEEAVYNEEINLRPAIVGSSSVPVDGVFIDDGPVELLRLLQIIVECFTIFVIGGSLGVRKKFYVSSVEISQDENLMLLMLQFTEKYGVKLFLPCIKIVYMKRGRAGFKNNTHIGGI